MENFIRPIKMGELKWGEFQMWEKVIDAAVIIITEIAKELIKKQD